MGLIEKYGSGIKRIISAFRDNGLKRPIFRELGDGFVVEVYSKTTQKTTQKTILQKSIINLLRDHPYMTRIGLSNELGVSVNTIKENLLKLKQRKILKRIGPDKGGHWEIIQ
jgi:ATP-dependent DNA helicase RecG